MFSRRIAQRANTFTPSSFTIRPFTTTSWLQKSSDKAPAAPALADVKTEQAHLFDQRQTEFRQELATRARNEREQHESQSASAKASTEAKQTFSLDSAISSVQGGQGFDSTSGETAAANHNDSKKKVGSGPLSKLIYGTEEGRKMDQDIERSFSQVLARGKYVHSIVFHEVKPSKVDEYVELVGKWYPRMANMPENKVCQVQYWEAATKELNTSSNRFILSAPGALKLATAIRSSTFGSTNATPVTTLR
jgi:hypothetical protein